MSLKVLILFSNPADSPRLRLDKEERALDDLVRNLHGISDVEIVRIPAATTADLIRLVGEGDFEIVQFSGHGEPDQFYLEAPDSDEGTLIDTDLLAGILQLSTKHPRVLLLMSCFSSASISKLIPFVPYIITIEGPLSDRGAILFIKSFYENYIKFRSVQQAYDSAKLHLEASKLKTSTNVVFVKRARYDSEGKLLIDAQMALYPDVMTIDLSQVENSLDKLGLPLEEIFDLLARKIRVHSWIFATPRENVLIAIHSTLLGEFSWDASANYIRCHRLFRIREDITPEHWGHWSTLLLGYNDACASEYRLEKEPFNSATKHLLAKGLRAMNFLYKDEFGTIQGLIELGFKEAGRSLALGRSYLELAQRRFDEEDYAMTVAYLESSLSALHDILNATLPKA